MPQASDALDARDRALLFGEEELRIGDAVVHFEHGLARYDGVTEVEVEGATHRLTTFLYADGGKLMLPARLGRDFWAYGAPAEEVTLDRLDAGDWARRREEMIAEVNESVDALMEADRARRGRGAHALTWDAERYADFAATFEYDETEDQARAIAATLSDLGRDVPMNRLVVGDVGYGKTEVAIRAVAAAVLAGRQVALVAPTTILARQHAETLRTRFASLKIGMAELSRLATTADHDEALARIASGEARIVVGTLALLGEDVAFEDLAVVVIDEEQRFGRAQKANLRRLGDGCHVLSLTATPIPRSLALAEIGCLDVSVLATAPGARRPIETRIGRPSGKALREAVASEVARGGQAYVVCPRIDDMEAVAAMLEDGTEIPDFVAVHGQMSDDDLEDRMLRFMRGDVPVMLSTSIVESGLDNPRANAMVVCEADRFGLAQLHQLRGRIGRAGGQAHLLLLTNCPPEGEAMARLHALSEMTAMGDGFRIARRDRDLRGFGAVDGDAQSGHVSRLGIGLYRHLLCLRAAGQENTSGGRAA
jgi:transcription-repair coupling factor (superfamily II helicase)